MDWIRSSRGAVSLFTAFALFAAAAGALLGEGPLRSVFDLGDGFAWLGTTSDGDLTLVDGRTGEGVTRLDLDEDGKELEVVHRDGVAYVVAGGETLYRLDSADLASASSVAAISQGQRIVRGGDHAYLVHEADGTVQQIDPMTLDKQGRRLKYDKPIRAEADADGRLVVLERDRGQVFVVEGGSSGSAVDVGKASYLVDAGGVPTAVDLAGKNAYAFRVGKPTRVQMKSLPNGDRASILVPTRSEVDRVGVLVPNSGAAKLVLTDLRSADTLSNDFSMSDEEVAGLEAPFVAQRAVYLVNKSEGKVLVIDPKTLELRKEVQRLGDVGTSEKLEVFLKDGRLWINNPDGDKALIVDDDGSSRDVTKKSPEMPVVSPVVEVASETTPVGPSDAPGPVAQPGPDAGPTAGPGAPPTTAPGPVVPPERPNFEGNPGNREARLTWSANGDGGSSITGWTLTWVDGSGAEKERTYGPADRSAVIDRLRNGRTYEFELRARNAAAEPSPAARVEVRPTSEVPEQVTGVQATSTADGAVDVSWDATDGNGKDVKTYQVWAKAVGDPQPQEPTAITDGETRATLPPGSFPVGTEIEITLTATSVGTSEPSDPVVLRVASRPGLPALSYSPNLLSATATLLCDAACRGAADAVQFRMWTEPATREFTGSLDADGTASHEFQGLQERTPYRILAEVDNGLGTSSTEQGYVTPGRPVVNGPVVGATPPYDRTVVVSVAVDAGNRPVTCNFIGNGRSTGWGGCSGRSLDLGGTYSTTYGVTAEVSNDLGGASGSGNVTTGPKRLVADGRHWGCPGAFCGETVSRYPSTAYDSAQKTVVGLGTEIFATCQQGGNSITDRVTGSSTTLWVRSQYTDGRPWMSAHYFGTTDFGGVVSGLPAC